MGSPYLAKKGNTRLSPHGSEDNICWKRNWTTFYVNMNQLIQHSKQTEPSFMTMRRRSSSLHHIYCMFTKSMAMCKKVVLFDILPFFCAIHGHGPMNFPEISGACRNANEKGSGISPFWVICKEPASPIHLEPSSTRFLNASFAFVRSVLSRWGPPGMGSIPSTQEVLRIPDLPWVSTHDKMHSLMNHGGSQQLSGSSRSYQIIADTRYHLSTPVDTNCP